MAEPALHENASPNCGHVGERTAHAEARRGVRVRLHDHALEVRPIDRAPTLSKAQEELLIFSHAVGHDGFFRVAAERTVGLERELEPAVVRDVFAQRERAVHVQTW